MKYQPGKVQVRLHLYTVTTAHKAKTSKIVLQTSSHIRILWVFPSNSYFHRHWASQKISKETFCLGRSPFREQKPWENHQTCTGGSGQNRYTCHCFKKMWHVSFLPPQNVQSFAVFLGPVKPGRNPPLKPVDTTIFIRHNQKKPHHESTHEEEPNTFPTVRLKGRVSSSTALQFWNDVPDNVCSAPR